MVYLVRAVHGMIAVFLLSCLAYVYYAGITGHPTMLAYIAVLALLVEGLVIFVSVVVTAIRTLLLTWRVC